MEIPGHEHVDMHKHDYLVKNETIVCSAGQRGVDATSRFCSGMPEPKRIGASVVEAQEG